MTGSSVSFLMFAAVVILLVNFWQRTEWRHSVLLIASIAFVWMCADKQSLLPMAAFLGLGYVGLKLIESGHLRSAAPAVVITILIFIWLKKYTFLPSSIFLPVTYSTVGLSYIFFRIIHLMVDADNKNLPDRVGLASYLTYTLNFTTLVAGPIQRYQDFDESCRTARRPSVLKVGAAIERIILGFFKTNVLALVFSLLQTGAISRLAAAPEWRTRVVQGAIMIAAYPFFLYCNFSGYIDIVIGIAQLMGLHLPENFDRPFSASSFIDFWNRWHITLSTWLKTYVYVPVVMALMSRYPSETLAPLWGVLAFFVTFFLVGVWHGRTATFLFFGVLQGLGVSINKLFEIAMVAALSRKRTRAVTANPIYIAVCRGLTFTWFAFTLLWFWSSWRNLANLAGTMGKSTIAMAICLIFVASTLGLALWESVRAASLRIQWRDLIILRSRYIRTAWCTVLVLVTTTTMLLMNQEVPEIVYKAF